MASIYKGRKAEPYLMFNGANVISQLKDYLIGITYTDAAHSQSDSLDIDLYDQDMVWLKGWYPTKGDIVSGFTRFRQWNSTNDLFYLPFGTLMLDSIKFSGNPLRCRFGALSIPQDQSFKTRQRTKTWENVTLSGIGSEIAGRYGLGFEFNASDTFIESLEQTDKTDSDFLYSTAKDYGLKLKVYHRKLLMFDAGRLEALAPVCTIDRKDFIDDAWSYDDELEGTYTGAIIAYKSDKSNEEADEIKLNVGDTSRRVLYINQKCDNAAEADTKARMQVNEANENMTKLSGAVWMWRILYSGQTVNITGLGHANGKYYIDKVTTAMTDSGTKQTLEMHKCYRRL